jgi:hypothetical protein
MVMGGVQNVNWKEVELFFYAELMQYNQNILI